LPAVIDHSSLDFSHQLPASPLQRLQSAFLDNAGIELYVKRDDLIHPQLGGNKWRKLKHNLIYARENQFDTLLTFGGAWSNHIYATAAAGKQLGFNTIGLIRGEPHTPLNTTLSFAEACGMKLHYIDRQQYRHKHEPSFLTGIKKQFGKVYILPEGGSNALAVKGCAETVHEISSETGGAFDVICCASGTGATLAGLITGIDEVKYASKKSAIGFSALKGGKFLTTEVSNFLGDMNTASNWRIESRFHFGGYAKITAELIAFMRQFHSQYDIELDAVYTAKMFYGLFELIKSGIFNPGTVIVAVHSGGLQGNKGFNL